MIPLLYIIGICAAMVSIGIAAVIIEKNFITIMLAVELIFMASTIAFVGFYSYSSAPGPWAFIGIFSVWSVAAVEIISLIAIYVYMKARGFNFDIGILTKFKW